ncbi:MAG: hypothetical protein J6N19_13495 [Clostridium sp.]|nr:hypothetical protein [Clostridium sp.]
MFENENGGMVMPVGPMYGNGGGFGMGGDWAWIILLLLAFGGGWGNGFGGGFGGDGLYPWLNNSQNINGGFRDQMLNTQLNGIQNGITAGFGDVQNALCAGFAGVNAGIANGFAQAEISENARQMANMNQMFGIQSALQQCCCDNRAATADLKYTVATEACADRAANDANTQKILDKLCQLELDNVKNQLAQAQRENVGLQNQINIAAFERSQAEQNALFAQGMNNEVDALYNRLANCPVPTTPVYGRTPIFTCNNQNTGCGCNNGFVN